MRDENAKEEQKTVIDETLTEEERAAIREKQNTPVPEFDSDEELIEEYGVDGEYETDEKEDEE